MITVRIMRWYVTNAILAYVPAQKLSWIHPEATLSPRIWIDESFLAHAHELSAPSRMDSTSARIPLPKYCLYTRPSGKRLHR